MAGASTGRGRYRFTFDGRSYQGFAGDTLASALLAQGVRLFGRSFKYHRPRGLLAAGTEEPNALVTVIRDAARRTPNVQATQVEIYEGLVAESQNRWPSLGFDLNAVNGLLSPLLTSGFYYKTFMWPRFAWHRWYEPVIRAAAGPAHAPRVAGSGSVRAAVCALRRAGGRRWPGRSRRGARGGSDRRACHPV